jgi:ABC-type branched-subunit amino acid transport system permease subunit
MSDLSKNIQTSRHPRIKLPLTTKSVFDNWIRILSAHCTFPNVGLQLNPVNNYFIMNMILINLIAAIGLQLLIGFTGLLSLGMPLLWGWAPTPPPCW